MAAGEWDLAIDLGFSFTTVATSVEGRGTVLEIDGSRYVPSLVCLDDDGTILVGREAFNESTMAPDRTERVPKRALVTSEQVLLGERAVATVDLVAAVLGRVAGEAVRRFSGRRPERVVLTHPARWQAGGLELRRLTEAAKRAGLGEPDLVAEPVAAAHHCVRAGTAVPDGGMIGVYDFGGTFDTAVLRRRGDTLEIAGLPSGDVALSGEVLDAAFMKILAKRAEELDPNRWAELWEAEDRVAERHRTLLRRDVTQAKEALSRLPAISLWVPGYDDEIRVTRREYERAVEPLLVRSVTELRDTISRAGTTPNALVDVLLTGGVSRTPRITALLADLLGQVPSLVDDPKTAIVLGALLPRFDPLRRDERKITNEERARIDVARTRPEKTIMTTRSSTEAKPTATTASSLGVFISYRRATSWHLARLLYSDLTVNGYDVFMDVANLDSGDFDRQILDEIGKRAHFIAILQPATQLNRSTDRIDWMRREIVHALRLGRNIVPVMSDGFSFAAEVALPADIERLATFNGVTVYPDYFDEAMNRLRVRYLRNAT